MTSEIIPPQSPIANEEVLYRVVMNDARFFPHDSQGIRRVSSMAFNDAGRRPSVDRAMLCSGGPAETRERFRPGSGVLSLLTGEVRQLTAAHGTTGQIYGVDVEPVPLPDNPAHAEIFGRPPFDTDKVFDRIKHSLARLAVMTILPDSVPPSK